jgi:phosphoglycerol transferase
MFFIVTSILFLHTLYIQYPIVFSDEAVYALHSKFLNNPRFTVSRPNILYFYVYHVTSWFGVNHLVVAKLFNSIFFGLALFPLYATARQFVSQRAACIFALIVVLSPVSSYSVYVMPESMYFFVFWILVYVAVVQLPRNLMSGGLNAGLVLAALSTIKPHGLILIAAVPIVLAGVYFQNPDEISVGTLVRANIFFFVAFVVGRLAINYIVRGNFVLSPFGSYYAGILTPSMEARRPLLPPGLWHSLRGHLSYLAILFWPAIVLAIWPSEASGARSRASTHYVALLSFSFVALALLMLMAAKFTADVTGLGAAERACRLHGRYYDFALSLLMLLFLAGTNTATRPPRWSRLLGAVLVGGTIAAAVAAYFTFINYCPNLVDFPEVACFARIRVGLALVISGAVGSAVCLATLSRTTARIAYLGFISTVALTTSAGVFVGQKLFIWSPPAPDLAAIAVRSLVPNQVDDGIVVVRVEDGRGYRAQFQLDSLAGQKILDRPVLSANDIPAGTKWALLLDPYTLNLPYSSMVRGPGFEFLQFAPGGIVAGGGANPESSATPAPQP